MVENGRTAPSPGGLARRRIIVAVLVAVIAVLPAAWLIRILSTDGLTVVDLVLVILFALPLPWVALGVVNACVGSALMLGSRLSSAAIRPWPPDEDPHRPIRSRVALCVPVYNEDAVELFRGLEAMAADLAATGAAEPFSIVVLSDTTNSTIASAELELATAWRGRTAPPLPLSYRRRADNQGHKTGNLWEWLEREGDRFDLMLVLDADSVMSAEAVRRLVRTMEARPELGIVQHLTVGMPSLSPFARLFQFGMRHGMRTYTLGSAWWQGDCGPYWGHNAVIRVAPFKAHCRLPDLPGQPPLGGRVLSHDQVEAVQMRAAGWGVRVLPEERGSFERNPPSAIEFFERERRWGQGNLQYLRLMPRLRAHAMGRVQLWLAILMYANGPSLVAFAALSIGRDAARGTGFPIPDPELLGPGLLGRSAPSETLLLVGAMLALSFAPKLLGLAQMLRRGDVARAYGGRAALAISAACELLFSLWLTPLTLLVQARIALETLLGRDGGWEGQVRTRERVGLDEALRAQRLHVGTGLVLLALCPWLGSAAFAWALALGLLLAASPFFVIVTARERLGRWMAHHAIGAIPEEVEPPPVLVRMGQARRRADAATRVGPAVVSST